VSKALSEPVQQIVIGEDRVLRPSRRSWRPTSSDKALSHLSAGVVCSAI